MDDCRAHRPGAGPSAALQLAAACNSPMARLACTRALCASNMLQEVAVPPATQASPLRLKSVSVNWNRLGLIGWFSFSFSSKLIYDFGTTKEAKNENDQLAAIDVSNRRSKRPEGGAFSSSVVRERQAAPVFFVPRRSEPWPSPRATEQRSVATELCFGGPTPQICSVG